MKEIAIGNDFRVSWTLKQLGQAFELFGKTFDIVVKSPYAVIRVDDIQAVGNVVSFNVPASEQIYIGSYDIEINIDDDAPRKRWTLRQCNAFALAPCCECSDVVEVVQLESNIVYPANGLSAYELAVLNGEYTGDYDGYQRWLARYADSTANEAVNIANEAKENASTALSTAQLAKVVANDAKTAIATKQDTLTLTVKDNGNIVIGNIQGQTKEFMPATPSGDPNHYMYEKCGAVWNGYTGYWELNGLTDMTNEDMQDSYLKCNMYYNRIVKQSEYQNRLFRTNFYLDVGDVSSSMSGVVMANSFNGCYKTEILNFGTSYNMIGNCINAFSGCTLLKEIQGKLRFNKNTTVTNMVRNCNLLSIFQFNNVATNIELYYQKNEDTLQQFKVSLLYLINNASSTETFEIKLAEDVYEWAKQDADIITALTNKTITITS